MDIVKVFNGKKFMWDGNTYPNKEGADEASQKYQKDGFETQVIEDEGRYLSLAVGS